MISGRTSRQLRWTTIALLLAGSASATELDSLLAALARPVPTETGFVERRESALLDAPLLLSGRLLRPQAGTLVRQVEQPFSERTTIDGQRVRIEREGSRARSFSLRRAPELVAVLASFQALLDGDRGALEPHYRIAFEHDDAGWQILLTPRQPRLLQRLGRIGLHGSGDELACIATRGGEGGDSLMLIGAAADRESPAFEHHCPPPA
jgi:hypothetical protein